MSEERTDVVVVGAGAAGLAAARHLAGEGLEVTMLEARDRIGGRIFTRHVPSLALPVELGAEFIHGKPSEIWDAVRAARLTTHEVGGERWCWHGDDLAPCNGLLSQLEKLFERMSAAAGDCSFAEFIERDARDEAPEVKARALALVEGFNAADARRISVRWLAESREADEKIDGDRAYRILDGYDALVASLAQTDQAHPYALCLRTAAREVRWGPGAVEVVATDGRKFRAPRALITLPLGVLQAFPELPGAVAFEPAMDGKRAALRRLAVGPVMRCTLVFRKRFWERLERAGKPLAGLSFLFSDDERFPTWWSSMPSRAPILTGWAAGRRAEPLSFREESFVVERAVTSLAKLLRVKRAELVRLLESAHLHDWQADPFSRGAYSYVLVGGAAAPRELAQPVEQTLFFAGEATDMTGHNGTVHGAIASGERAAAEILASLSRT